MNVLSIIIAYFPFMAVIQVYEKLLKNDFFQTCLTVLIACREVFTGVIQKNPLQN